MQIDASSLEGKVSQPPETRSRGRWILLLLLMFFAVPLLLVVIMHEYDWHPQGSSYGDLVAPARQLVMPAGLLSATGQPVTATIWHDKWSMVYIADDCQADCQQRLHSMRQLHVSLAKDIERIQRVLVTNSDTTVLQQQYPDLLIINQPVSALAGLTQQFTESIKSESTPVSVHETKRLYLVDPLGNLMMSFPETVSDADVRKDISKLLRYSWAG